MTRPVCITPARADVSATRPRWLHFNLADTGACLWTQACTAIPEEARELLLDSDTPIRCE